METASRVVPLRILIFGLHLFVAALSFSLHCDARRPMRLVRGGSRHPRSGSSIITKPREKIHISKHWLDINNGAVQLDDSNTGPYGVSSPFSLPPYESLAPIPLPENAPPFCVYPPFTPQPPSTTIPFPPPSSGSGGGGSYPPISLPPPSSSSSSPSTPPLLPFQSPPPSPSGAGGGVPSPPQFIPSPIPVPNPPQTVPSPPPGSVIEPSTPPTPTFEPSPTQPILSPPYYFEPSPPGSVVPISPPFGVPSGPSIFVPSPPVFQPPVVYPPPAVPPPPKGKGPNMALWCVAKPTVPDPIIQEAMNYACGSGGDCDSILPSGPCFQPNTLFAHASYAFNSYWQRTKVAGGTCDFGGTAMLVTVDPSYDGCHFVFF